MKKLFCLATSIFFLTPFLKAGNHLQNADPGVFVSKIWADHDVTVNGKDGLRIHFALTVRDMKGQDFKLQLFVAINNDVPDNYIRNKGVRNGYHNDSGYLAISKMIIPNDNLVAYDDISLFLPYDEFMLDPGEYDLIINAFAMYPDNRLIGYLDYYEFEFTSAAASRGAKNKQFRTQTAPSARCDSMWVDFDVKESDILGMKVHFKFVAYNMKDSAGYVFCQFHYGDGRGALKDGNNKYNSNRGGVATWANLKPGFDPASFNDFVVFMPYSELELAKGRHQIIMETKLILNDGTVAGYFPLYTFTINQN